MILLFQERLGWDLYRPLGLEWERGGYWLLGGGEPTAIAYLDILPVYWMEDDGFWRWPSSLTEATHKCMTWQQFVDADLDVLIFTHPSHERCWHELRDKYHPKAKVIRVMGNVGEVKQGYAQNIIDTTGLYPGPENYVHVHQEFPLDIFEWNPPPEEKVISQYLNFFHKHPMRPWLEAYKAQMPEYTWKIHGHKEPGADGDGFLYPVRKIAEAMSASQFVWHIKQEGYGHIIHNAFAASRPVITNMGDYIHKTAGAMLVDQQTCINVGGLSVEAGVAKIRHLSDWETISWMCDNVRHRFAQVVDFAADAEKVREFAGRLR